MNKKRKQHYVWEYYLSAWATGGQLWCRRGGKIFLSSTENVGQRRDFYRLKEISELDIKLVEKYVIDGVAEHLKSAARDWIPYFRIPFIMRKIVEKHELTREDKIRLVSNMAGKDASLVSDEDIYTLDELIITNTGSDPGVGALIDVTINNLEEDLHASIEREAIPILSELQEKRADFLNDDEKYSMFSLYLASQYLRTPKIMKGMSPALESIPGFNGDASFGLIRMIFSTTMGGAFATRRHSIRLRFLTAPPGSTFIAADQPLINIRQVNKPLGSPATDMEFFYPVSPEIAVLIDFDYNTRSIEYVHLSHDDVDIYNKNIASMSDEMIFSFSREPLANIDN